MGAVRLLVSIVTHILLAEELKEGLAIMKYALNHPWKFVSYEKAFCAGLVQAGVVVAVEISTFYILVFSSDTIFDILANYAIVLVIADFGKNFATIESAGRAKRIFSEEKYKQIFTWEVTSSTSAADKIPENELKTENVLNEKEALKRPKYIYLGFLGRTWGNRILYIVYRLITMINNSIWYYFAPFLFTQVAFFYLIRQSHAIREAAEDSANGGGD
uniref:Uncharacterized protein n=1 Tax=Favella ehrenbergii TaxID=182087 RepID=A0A7S3MJ69_9SPIT|mmetsp:Transcript_184/g.258  ORF Transcript_184/g.258 Transcript_184/m.258 type:complete len:217 (+) Transcript_184:108-758(+)|eukprot:CAMPEP_0170465476 /NCGR_PEP_ID=MMETSP0123-20130129/9805_1 /TAXON_ID=182087 /ORGANISM="Favella ehrenbergii, Strain Fehren 1" /LENGTH=216 /DNA_ID=CAMNT_0010731381 /DNA_START=1614 /DNA_END=2264 /DNA_ORIENTATION=-